MAKRNQLISVVAGTALVGIAAYLGYRVYKKIDTFDLGDISWEDIDDIYHYRHKTNSEGPKGHE